MYFTIRLDGDDRQCILVPIGATTDGHKEGVSYQHTETWTQPPNPEFEVKRSRVSTSTKRCPEGAAR